MKNDFLYFHIRISLRNNWRTENEKGLKSGTTVYLSEPENHDKFKLAGKELIPDLKKR